MSTVAKEELDELKDRYFDLLMKATHSGDTTEVEKMDVRIKAMEARVNLHRPLEDTELQKLIDEVENDWRYSKEETEVFEEAERAFMMRQMKSDAAHISSTGRGISPVDEESTTFDYEFDMKHDQAAPDNGEHGPQRPE